MTTLPQPTGTEVKHEAFHTHRRAGQTGKQQRSVLDALTAGPMTRNQIAARIRLPLSSVCGRCRELLDVDLVTVMGTTDDKPARQLLALTPAGWAHMQAIEEGVNDASA